VQCKSTLCVCVCVCVCYPNHHHQSNHLDYTSRSIIDGLILAMICGCLGVLSGYRHVFGSVRFGKLAQHVQGSSSLEFSCIEAFYYTTHFIHMALLACRLKRNLLAGVYS
jgi:hypothetical protein